VIFPIDEAELGHESETTHGRRGVSPTPFTPNKASTTLRKRGLSNVDMQNIKTYKLNTSASLQNEFDKRLKERKGNKNPLDLSALQPKLNDIKGNAYFNG
jgi:hypothetical protein